MVAAFVSLLASFSIGLVQEAFGGPKVDPKWLGLTFFAAFAVVEILAQLMHLSVAVEESGPRILETLRNEVHFLDVMDKLRAKRDSLYLKRHPDFMPREIHHQPVELLVDSLRTTLDYLAGYVADEDHADYCRALYELAQNELNWDMKHKQVAVNREVLTTTISTLSKLTVAKYQNNGVILCMSAQLPSEHYMLKEGDIPDVGGKQAWISAFFEETQKLNRKWKKKYQGLEYHRIIGTVKRGENSPNIQVYCVMPQEECGSGEAVSPISSWKVQTFDRPAFPTLEQLRGNLNQSQLEMHVKWYLEDYNLKPEHAGYIVFDDVLGHDLSFLKDIRWLYAFGNKGKIGAHKEKIHWEFAVSAQVTLDNPVMFLIFWDKAKMQNYILYKDHTNPGGAMMPDFLDRIVASKRPIRDLIRSGRAEIREDVTSVPAT